MIQNYVYPAIFTTNKDGFSVRFPDLPGTNTQGETEADAITNARKALSQWIVFLKDEKEEIPVASKIADIKLNSKQFASLIDADIKEYLRTQDTRAVKKTLTIPSWLNREAEEKGLNFSSVLQEGLKQRLSIK